MVALTPSTKAEDNPVDILLVDSRQLVRAGIEQVSSDSSDLTVSDAAANCDEAIRLARRRQPQPIIINIPGCSVEELPTAIGTVMKGERYINDCLARKLAERHLPGHEGSPSDRLRHRKLKIFLHMQTEVELMHLAIWQGLVRVPGTATDMNSKT